MKVIFVRHSEPDYSDLDGNPSYVGFGRDLAPLTENGRLLAQKASFHPLLEDVELVISSSITRALETATYLVRPKALPLLVEPFFHEWRPDKDGLNYSLDMLEKSYNLFWENDGQLAKNSPLNYETAAEMQERFLRALEKYKDYQTVLIVAHGMLIRQFVPLEIIEYCQFIECEINI